MTGIGERIAQKRKEKRWSQDRLAREVNCSQSLIAKYERNERNIQTDELINIANVLGTNTDFLLRGTDSQNLGIVDDLHLDNEAINSLREYLGEDELMQLDNAKEAVNFFLSNRDGFSIIAQLYAYLFADCSWTLHNHEQIPSDELRVPLKCGIQAENVMATYHLSADDFSEMLLQKLADNLKNWRKELQGTKKGDRI